MRSKKEQGKENQNQRTDWTRLNKPILQMTFVVGICQYGQKKLEMRDLQRGAKQGRGVNIEA